ncbi:hypothetical protein D0N87_36095, partial [Pseudomonas sp. ATCC 13867]
EVKAAKCDNPVNKQLELGQMVGVQGTPAIILANGQMLPGYQPPARSPSWPWRPSKPRAAL